MTPEEVPDALVEKAARAVEADLLDPENRAVWETEIRTVLAAVLPDIQAQAFEAAASKVRADWAPHRCPWVGFLDDEAARLRATTVIETRDAQRSRAAAQDDDGDPSWSTTEEPSA